MSGRTDSVQLRFIVYKGRKYLLAEDVADYVLQLGSAEETDVRTRLAKAANNLRGT